MTASPGMSAAQPGALADSRTLAGTRLRLQLLSEGLRVDWDALPAAAKPALRVRSGSCGGLDLVLADGTWVNAPVHEPWAKQSEFELVAHGTGWSVRGPAVEMAASVLRAPAYYDNSGVTTAGTAMKDVGQLCSDRIGVGLTNVCTFYRRRDDRCAFCSIGANVRNERARKDGADVVETVLASVRDPLNPAAHVLLGGGTFDRDGGSAPQIAHVAAAIRAVTDVPIYAMITPPKDLGLLRELRDAGVDELGMNIEVFGEAAARTWIPGKHATISTDRYWEALEAAVSVFGPIATRSITVVGLEPAADTVAGVDRLASLGVMPILSPLRPLKGTRLADHHRLTADELWELLVACSQAAGRHGIPLGPTCIACQSNTLTMPGHPSYRHYGVAAPSTA